MNISQISSTVIYSTQKSHHRSCPHLRTIPPSLFLAVRDQRQILRSVHPDGRDEAVRHPGHGYQIVGPETDQLKPSNMTAGQGLDFYEITFVLIQ